jgi:hypothetical protein
MRRALYRTLEKHWTEGAAALASDGSDGDLVRDPGFLVLVKMLLQEEADHRSERFPAHRLGARAPASDRGPTTNRLYQVKRVRDERREKLEEVEKEWVELLESLHSKMCSRFHAAALRQADADRVAGHHRDWSDELRYLPLKLHADARVAAACSVDWAEEVRGKLPGSEADPMTIHYVRIEEETRPAKMLGTYRRRLEDCTLREIEHGISLESLLSGSRPGRIRSVDARITRATPGVPELHSEDQPLVVDILSIEINDPSDAAWETGSLTEN